MSRLWGRGWKLALPILGVGLVAAMAAASTFAASATPIKVAVLSDCEGAFGAFDGQDLAGVVSAMSEYAGAKPVNPIRARAGRAGRSVDIRSSSSASGAATTGPIPRSRKPSGSWSSSVRTS
jgi:hypothetical protein